MPRAQVGSKLYGSPRYLDASRWFSYALQYAGVLECAPASCLEVGIGNGIITHALRFAGVAVTTCDIDESLRPDYVGSVTNLSFNDDSFDCILCAEVLEHIPFTDVPRALSELWRVTRRYCVISVPYPAATFSISFKIPFFRQRFFMARIPLFWRHPLWNGEHYWEMGMRGFSRASFMRYITAARFSVIRIPASDNNPYHAFFILEKIS
jgi:SAM-dependent methyltransferase